MKKTLLAALLIVSAQAAFSQIYKGQWMVGGDMSVTSSKTKTSVGGTSTTSPSTTLVMINPDAGYFFMDKLSGGLRLNFTSATGGYHDLMVGPFVRYYFLPAAQQVNVFLDGSVGFGSTKASSSSDSHSSTAFQFMAGPAIFLNPHVALQIAPFFRSQWESETVGGVKYKSTDNTFGGMVGFQIHLGKGKTGK